MHTQHNSCPSHNCTTKSPLVDISHFHNIFSPVQALQATHPAHVRHSQLLCTLCSLAHLRSANGWFFRPFHRCWAEKCIWAALRAISTRSIMGALFGVIWVMPSAFYFLSHNDLWFMKKTRRWSISNSCPCTVVPIRNVWLETFSSLFVLYCTCCSLEWVWHIALHRCSFSSLWFLCCSH